MIYGNHRKLMSLAPLGALIKMMKVNLRIFQGPCFFWLKVLICLILICFVYACDLTNFIHRPKYMGGECHNNHQD